MAGNFGLTPQGFKPMSFAEVKADIENALQSRLGTNLNLAPESVFGQLSGILSERLSLLWQLAQAEANAYNPAAATGLAVDNILALNNLQRLAARPTVTAPQPTTDNRGITLFGLVLLGTPGTTIPAGALVSDGRAIPATFAIDSTVTIGAPSNARQTVLFSNNPDVGSFQLEIFNAAGKVFSLPSFEAGASVAAVQAALVAVQDADTQLFPFTDVVVSGAPNGLVFDFGAGTPAQGQPATASQAIPLIAVAQSTLRQGTAATNLTLLEARVGAPAQGIGSATCTALGPQPVLAGELNTIVTPQMGWTGVVNQLDCLTGANTETDGDAIARFNELRASQGSGSLAAIVQRVRQVAGVTSCTGFDNQTNAAQQTLNFLGTPNSGSYQLALAEGTTANLAFNASAGDVRKALAALPGYAPVRVSGTPAYGFTINFNGSVGGQAVPLVTVLNNSTGVALQPNFARPPHAVEIVVAGGSDTDIAKAIVNALPAGLTSYGAPVVNTLGSVQVGSNQLALASALNVSAGLTINMSAVPLGTQVASVNNNTITMNQKATATVSGAPCILNHAPLLADSAGNPQLLGFSRPVPTPIYVQIVLVTDQYLVPGDPTSGPNSASQWNPASVATVQANLLAIGNTIAVGGLIVARGTSGLIGSFNDIPGVYDYTLTFGTAPLPTGSDAIQMQPNQAPIFESSNIAVAYK